MCEQSDRSDRDVAWILEPVRAARATLHDLECERQRMPAGALRDEWTRRIRSAAAAVRSAKIEGDRRRIIVDERAAIVDRIQTVAKRGA